MASRPSPLEMKPLAWIITGVLVIVAGALWLRSLPSGGGPSSTDPERAAAAGAGDPLEGSQRRPAGVQGPAQGPALAPREERVTELWAVLGSGRPHDARRERELMQELVVEGGAAIDAVVEAVEDERSQLHGDGGGLELLLRGSAPRPSVYHLARRRLDLLASDPAAGVPVAQITPWYRLAARHGGPRGVSFVLEQLGSDDPAMSRAAARAAGGLGDPADRMLVLSALFGDASLSPQVVSALAEVLAAQDDEVLRAGLFDRALQHGESVDRRAALLLALGRFLDETRLDPYLVLYRSSAEEGLRKGVLEGLLRVRTGEHLSDATLDLQLEPFVLELLADPDETWAGWGARLVRDVAALHDLGTARAALEARLAAGTSAQLAGTLKSALTALDG